MGRDRCGDGVLKMAEGVPFVVERFGDDVREPWT